MGIDCRPYRGPDDLRGLQRLAQDVWRFDPRCVDVGGTVGEIAWSLGGLHADEYWSGRVWLDGQSVVAWATLQWEPTIISHPGERTQRPDTLDWQVHPSRPELFDSVLDWAEAAARSTALATSARPANVSAVAILERRGYGVESRAPWNLLNIRSLDDVEEPSLPDDYRLTTMAEVEDLTKRVAVHRAAWDGSTMTEQRYTEVMRTWPYRADLDCVVEAPGGELVASALAWFDPALALGELEPVGTHRNHRRKGLGKAVNLFALQQLCRAGATQAIVASRGDDDYPMPTALYRSVGFRELSRQTPYVKQL